MLRRLLTLPSGAREFDEYKSYSHAENCEREMMDMFTTSDTAGKHRPRRNTSLIRRCSATGSNS